VTANKSQGQTLGIVGLDLRTSAFTHGQLYIAMPRITNVKDSQCVNAEIGRPNSTIPHVCPCDFLMDIAKQSSQHRAGELAAELVVGELAGIATRDVCFGVYCLQRPGYS